MKFSDEQIEKAAKAAFFARYRLDPHPAAWDEIGAKHQSRWHAVARAALEAVMPEGEPSAHLIWRPGTGWRVEMVGRGAAEFLAGEDGDIVPLYEHPAPEPGEVERLLAENERLREAHRENNRLLGLVAHDLTGRVEGGKVAAIYTAISRARAALAEGGRDE